MQATLHHKTVENIYGLLQLSPRGGDCWRENILLSRGTKSRSILYGANSTHYAANGCSGPRPVMWSIVVWSRQGYHGMGRKRSRRELHIWSWGKTPINPLKYWILQHNSFCNSRLWVNFYKNTSSTSFVVPIKLLRMVTNSLPSDSWSHFSRPPIIAANLTMRVSDHW